MAWAKKIWLPDGTTGGFTASEINRHEEGIDEALQAPLVKRGETGAESGTYNPFTYPNNQRIFDVDSDLAQSSANEMKLTFTPITTREHLVSGRGLMRGMDAAWSTVIFGLWLQPADLDGRVWIFDYLQLHNSLGYESGSAHGAFRLQAGTPYTLYAVVRGNANIRTQSDPIYQNLTVMR